MILNILGVLLLFMVVSSFFAWIVSGETHTPFKKHIWWAMKGVLTGWVLVGLTVLAIWLITLKG